MTNTTDIIIVGGGIAGASLGAQLAPHASTIILEMEEHPGYHSTGRSAAMFDSSYGSETVRQFTAASRCFFSSPPAGFSDNKLLSPRDSIFVARYDQMAALEKLQSECPDMQKLSVDELVSRVPILSTEYISAGLLDASGGDLDVDAILQGYLRQFNQMGGVLKRKQKVKSLVNKDGLWELRCEGSTYRASIIVNAAGAWADSVASMAGARPLGITPLRRSAILIDPPDGVNIDTWPMVVDIEDEFYFKPDGGKIMVSPANEDETDACDVQPEELEIAFAAHYFENATGYQVKRVRHKWAGLRNFSPDREFVVGFDPEVNGLFWLAGQGGFGIQTAPALAAFAASLVLNTELPREMIHLSNLKDTLSPERPIGRRD